jgi:hypothetical protein
MSEENTPKEKGASSLINRAALKRFLLDRAKTMRPGHEFSRVSEETFEHLEAQLRNAAVELIRRHPSKGVTIKP